jgi:hypothetical protein
MGKLVLAWVKGVLYLLEKTPVPDQYFIQEFELGSTFADSGIFFKSGELVTLSMFKTYSVSNREWYPHENGRIMVRSLKQIVGDILSKRVRWGENRTLTYTVEGKIPTNSFDSLLYVALNMS